MRPSRASVRLRVASVATALICIALATAGVVSTRLLRSSLANDDDAVLVDRLDEVQLLVDAGQLATVIEATGRETGQLQVVDEGGAVVAATPGLAASSRLAAIDAPPMGQQVSATVDGGRVDGNAGEQFRVVARTVASARGPLTIYGATSLRIAQRAEEHLEHVLIVVLPLLAVLAAALIWWVVGRALAPVDAMRSVVDRIEATDLEQRVAIGRGRDEIGRLGLTLNRMLGRLDDAQRRQRVFAAAASHELRSPLSAIRTELEVGLAYPARTDWEEVAQESLVEVGRLERLARDLLELTQLQAAAPTTRPVPIDLAELVDNELARRPAPSGRCRTAEVEHVTIMADPGHVVRLLRNLLDNAERHAAGLIGVRVAGTGNDALLRIWNDGTPIPPADRERIFDPFTRLDDARALDEGGAGLGLAIARGLAEQVGGHLVVADSETGVEFVASFPAA